MLPLPVHDGYGATVLELELLRFYVDAPAMRVNESGAKKDEIRELVRKYKQNSERRVLDPDGQVSDRG